MAREWYFQVMGQELGPLSVAELKTKVGSGQIQRDTLVRKTLDGKWVFAEKVKGLFSVPEIELPPNVTAHSTSRKTPASAAAMPIVGFVQPHGSDQGTPVGGERNGSSTAKASFQESGVPTKFVPISTMALDDDDSDAGLAKPPSAEFYYFVGFREAISPALFDAVEQFVQSAGITMTQMNRRAIAEFIHRPELASDLMISAVAAIPQPVGAKSNSDGSHELNKDQQKECATFRFTLFNSGKETIHIRSGVFRPTSIESREYNRTEAGTFPSIDHAQHVKIDLTNAQNDQPIPFEVDLSIPPQQIQELVIWFHAREKPGFRKVKGQIWVGRGSDLSISEVFTVILHGDSPTLN